MVRSKKSSEQLQSFLVTTNRYEVITGWRRYTYKEKVNENIKQTSRKYSPTLLLQSCRYYFLKNQKAKNRRGKISQENGIFG